MLSLGGMGVAYALRLTGVRRWEAYVAFAGPLAWSGLVLSHLHPALALAFIVPFIPGPSRDSGLYEAADEVDEIGEAAARVFHIEHSPLHLFEHHVKSFVDFGLFFFAFANAGVPFADVGPMTWLVLGSLVVGKTLGITIFGLAAIALGFQLPDGMGRRDLAMTGLIAALGLTVALFVAGAAYLEPELQGQAKMGALLSGLVGPAAWVLGRWLGVGAKKEPDAEDPSSGDSPAAD